MAFSITQRGFNSIGSMMGGGLSSSIMSSSLASNIGSEVNSSSLSSLSSSSSSLSPSSGNIPLDNSLSDFSMKNNISDGIMGSSSVSSYSHLEPQVSDSLSSSFERLGIPKDFNFLSNSVASMDGSIMPSGVRGGDNNITSPNARITSEFSETRDHPVLGKVKPHKGVDIGGISEGQQAYAAEDGILIFGKEEVTEANIEKKRAAYGADKQLGELVGHGNRPFIMHTNPETGEKYTTLYAHLDSFDEKLHQKFLDGNKKGIPIKKGDPIGIIGSTGTSSGKHLHFEVFEGHKLYQNVKDPQSEKYKHLLEYQLNKIKGEE